jgi:hypothetical protein
MRKILSLCLYVFICVGLYAADSEKMEASNLVEKKIGNTLSGKVVDKITGEALAGVEIKLMGTEIKTYTDFEGNFELKNLSTGAHALKVDYISYQNVVENVFVKDENSTSITLKLKNVVQ